jgi:transposase
MGMRPYGTPERLERRRRYAIALLKSGKTYRTAATKVGASLSSVVRWHQVYRTRGNNGLKPKPVPGRPARMTEREKQQLVRVLVAGPLKAGYSTDVWTLPRIAQIIRKRFGIRFCLSNVWKLMAALGWSCQKPERRALQRDEKAIAHWKRYTWPHIKKRGSGWSPSGLRR